LFRNNILRLMEEQESVGASIDKNSDAILSGNRYIDAGKTYADTGFTSKPIALHRVARFYTDAGEDAGVVRIPIANAGVEAMECEVISENDWIAASIEDDGTLAPESIGWLVVKVNSEQLQKGVQVGRVKIVTPAQEIPVGVRLHLQ